MNTQHHVGQIHPKWEHPSNIMVVGPSKSGKTVFIRKMIRHNAWIFDPAPKKVVFLYGIWQETYEEMKQEFGDQVTWVQGLPEDPYPPFGDATPGLLIVDDLMGEMEKNHQHVSKWFTKGTHHMDVSLVVLVQNLFPNNMRTASLNAHIIVLFPNPRDRSQLTRLSSQAFPGQAEWFKRAMRYAQSRPYRPLILNFHQTTPQQYRLSVDPFPEDLKESKQPFPQILLET